MAGLVTEGTVCVCVYIYTELCGARYGDLAPLLSQRYSKVCLSY